MEEQIKNIILEYCEGITHLEFNVEYLDEIVKRIIEVKKLDTYDIPVCNHVWIDWGTSNFIPTYKCIKCGEIS